jgi:hypothetical protein
VSAWAHDLATRVKWALWNGQADKTLGHLEAIRCWTESERQPTSEVRKLRCFATDLLRFLGVNKDSLPNYGERHREGEPISTGWVESAINEIIAKRTSKCQTGSLDSGLSTPKLRNAWPHSRHEFLCSLRELGDSRAPPRCRYPATVISALRVPAANHGGDYTILIFGELGIGATLSC